MNIKFTKKNQNYNWNYNYAIIHQEKKSYLYKKGQWASFYMKSFNFFTTKPAENYLYGPQEHRKYETNWK